MARRARTVTSTAACVLFILVLTLPASAQYFGRNKVQYKKFDFQVLKTENFDIYYYPEEREGIEFAARMAERWRVRLGRILGHELSGRQPLVLYASHPDFEQTNTIQGELGEGTGGVTEPLRRRIVLPLAGPLADTDHVLGHEIVHAFQFDMTTRPDAPPGQNGASMIPLWFIEGMAEYLSLGPVDPHTAMWLRDAAQPLDEKERKEKKGRIDNLPTIKELDNGKYFPYRWGQAFWAYVAGRHGDDVIGQMLTTAAAAGGDTNVAIQRVLGVTPEELSDAWQDSIRRAYLPVLAATMPTSEIGRRVIGGGDELGADLNVGPAISPDGKWIAFLSARGVFSIDLFVADASTGKVVRKLTSTANDPHFSSLQFIYSAGAWDSGSERIAIATVAGGRPALAIFHAMSGDKQREIQLEEIDEIFNPTWAPDGRAICFTGMAQGLTDLFIYDLEASKLRRLTNDGYAELQPSWSPDGRRIAFATDRFSSDLGTLRIGEYHLALVDPATGEIEPLRVQASGKSINPQWTPDSRALLFISDRDGIANVYRVAIGSGELSRVTNVRTGVSGITGSSPALSVAARSGDIAFSLYETGKYDIYLTDPSTMVRPVPTTLADTAIAGVLPPLDDRRPSEVQALLANATLGLPPASATAYATEPYKGKLTLEGVAQPTVAVGVDRFGPAVGGGIGFQFADMLGNHSLTTVLQLNSGINGNFSLKNTAAQAIYLNQAHRVNWGIVGGQVPYLSGGFQSVLGTVAGEPAQIDQAIIFRQTEQSAAGLVAYPFNRAQRFEVQGGLTRISFDQIVESSAFSLNTGRLIAQDSVETSLDEPLTLGTTSAALVFDTSNFGPTSPVSGQRYRLEAAPTFGSLQFTNVLADYRRYFMPVPFYTIAGRVMHYGRYGNGGSDRRLSPLFLGYPNLVRGYDVGSFQAADCLPTALSECPAFDQLMGSRLLVGNLEFRFPLLRPFGASQQMYGPIPVEVAFFADGGVAWDRNEKPALFGGGREGVGSVGVAFRVNLLGFAVGEFDIARAFNRPSDRGWTFQFNLLPGF
jgi:Tol biopolymer transport system component